MCADAAHFAPVTTANNTSDREYPARAFTGIHGTLSLQMIGCGGIDGDG
jgi:hypothetical protein